MVFLRDNSLVPYSLLGELIESYYLFPKDVPLVLGPCINAELDTFWDYIASVPELSVSAWWIYGTHTVWGGVFRPDIRFTTRTDGGEAVYLPYLTTITTVDRVPVTVLFLISQERLTAELRRISDVDGTTATLWSNDGTLIVTTSPPTPAHSPPTPPSAGDIEMHEEGELFVTTRRLSAPRWTITLQQPKSAVERQVALISRLSRTIVVGLTIIGAALMVGVSLYSSRPLFVVLQEARTARLDPDPAIRSESDLRKVFGDLTIPANNVTQQLEAQRPVLRQLFLRNLLSGELSLNEIDEDLTLIDLTLRGRYQTVACIAFPAVKAGERALTQLGATEYLDRRFSKRSSRTRSTRSALRWWPTLRTPPPSRGAEGGHSPL